MGSGFDQIGRSLLIAPSRRGVTGFLVASVLAATGWGASARRKSKKKKKNRCKPACGECQTCRKRSCLAIADGTSCESGDICEDGQCVTLRCGSGPACVSPNVCIDEQCVPLRCGNGGACRVFNTVELFSGNELGGLARADEICQGKADAAGLEGTYLAWLSAGLESPANRFSNLAKAGPYRLPPGEGGGLGPIVAADFASLTSCVGVGTQCLQHAIDRSADGNTQLVENFPVWTGTLQNGAGATDSCGDWDSAGLGLIGDATVTDENWTNSQSKDCQLFAGSLYCFEQA